MDRLTFVFTQEIFADQATRYGLNARFSTGFGQAVIDWNLAFRRSGFPNRQPRLMRLELMTVMNRMSIPPSLCNCIFRLQKEGQPELECNVDGEADGGQHMRFSVPVDHPLMNAIGLPQENYLGPKTLLTAVIQMPKNRFIANFWEIPVEPTPVDFDFRFEPILNKEEHDLVIKCVDGEFPTNKGALFRSSNYCKKLFKNGWKDKREVEEEFSLATAEILFTFLFTHTFHAPSKLTSELVEEVKKAVERYAVPQKMQLLDGMEVMVCRQLSETDHSLQDLLQWLTMAGRICLVRLEECAALSVVKNFYRTLLEEYGPETVPMNEKKKEMMEMLHNRETRRGTTPFRKLVALHNSSNRVLVVEKTIKD